jgi:hypothetical protein
MVFLKDILQRCGVSLIAGGAFLICAWAQEFHPQFFFGLQKAVDGAAVARPFGDLHAILQAASCWRQGVNVYAPDACMGGGEYNYALLLLRFLDVLPPDDTDAAAILIDFLYIGVFSCLPKPCGRADFMFRVLAALSGASLYAASRANLDVVIFLLAFAGLVFLGRGVVGKLLGYALFILLAIIKFYPLTLLFLAVRERVFVLCWVAVMTCIGGWVFVASQAGDIVTAVRIIPHGSPFGGTFGAVNLFYGWDALRDSTGGAQGFWLHVAQAAGVALRFLCSGRYGDGLGRLDAPLKNLLAGGAVVISGCFLTAQNIDYRAIFLIWTIPGLAWLAGVPGRGGWRYWRLLWAVLFVLWEAFFREATGFFSGLWLSGEGFSAVNFGFWLLRELVWWWLAVQLAAILFAILKPEAARVLREMTLTTRVGKVYLNPCILNGTGSG